MPENFTDQIKRAVQEGRIKWQRHGLQRMMERNILREEVKQVLSNGELIEEYPDDFPLPSGLFLGFTENNTPLHIVSAVDNEVNWCYIVTVYRPDPEYFESDFKTRKK